VRAWGFWATLGFAVLAFGLGQAVAVASLAAWFGPNALSAVQYDGRAVTLVAAVSNTIEVVTLVLAVRLASGDVATYLGLSMPRRADLVVGAVCLAVLIAVGDIVTLLAGRDLVPPFQLEAYRTAQLTGSLPWLWIALVVVAPLGEEILFRGFLYRGWLQWAPDPWSVIVVISAIWSLLHIQYDWFGMLQVFVTGMLFGWLRWRSGSTILVILMHALLNLEGTMETALALGRAATP
jgi:membrane protease YdiL (CAAX protease family)